MIFDNVFGNIYRSAFGLNISSCDIFADDSDAAKLNAAEQKNQHNNRCIAGHCNFKEELLNNHHNKVDYRKQSRDKADDG